jgi:hypothetical protein
MIAPSEPGSRSRRKLLPSTWRTSSPRSRASATIDGSVSTPIASIPRRVSSSTSSARPQPMSTTGGLATSRSR